MRISLIQAPYWLGNPELPMAAGPTRIVEAGAAEALREAGNDVELASVEAAELDSDDGYYFNEIKGSFAVVGLVAERVREAVERGSFPVVLATNCLNTVGIVAGGSTDVGVVWFDAHADFSSTETTPSGFLDGQGLSILTGTGWDALRQTIPGYRTVPERTSAWRRPPSRWFPRASSRAGSKPGSTPCASAWPTCISTSTWTSSTPAREW